MSPREAPKVSNLTPCSSHWSGVCCCCQRPEHFRRHVPLASRARRGQERTVRVRLNLLDDEVRRCSDVWVGIGPRGRLEGAVNSRTGLTPAQLLVRRGSSRLGVTALGVKQQRVREPPRILAIGPTVDDANDCFDRSDVAERTSATATGQSPGGPASS